MHVGLNLIFLVPGETGGMEVYARQLIPELVELAPPGTRFTAFINRETAAGGGGGDGGGGGGGGGPWGEIVPAVTVPVNARSRIQWVAGEQALLPRLAARAGVDLVHSMASTAPGWGAFKRVVTVHDLIYARYPEAHGRLRALGMRALVPLAVRRADRVIAISQSTRRDLISMLSVPAGKIDVVPQGLTLAAATPTPATTAALAERLHISGRPVLLSLSAKRPHKNLLALIGALALIDADRRPVLVLPGYPTPHEAQLRQRASALGLDRDIRFLAWVSGEELEGLWSIARAFVYPSLYEGFGLPVLEAMARGVPVACSNASCLPEVAGDAAIMFDPHDERAIAQSIERLLADTAEAQRLREAGLARAALFTWRRTAELTLASYREAMGASAQREVSDAAQREGSDAARREADETYGSMPGLEIPPREERDRSRRR